DDAAGQQLRQRAEGRLVRDVARGEQQCRFLAVEVGQLSLEEDVIVIGSGNIAGAPGPRAATPQRLGHRFDHRRVLAHPEIVVAAPDDDLLRAKPGGLRWPVQRLWEGTCAALEIGKDAIPPLGLEAGNGVAEELLEIHTESLYSADHPADARPQA